MTLAFPRANQSGGVERVAAEFLKYHVRRRPTSFLGTTMELGDPVAEQDVRLIRVPESTAPRALRPRAFRLAAEKAIAGDRPVNLVSFGVQCPPGDVLWVHSVHAAWVARGSAAKVRGVEVPGGVRKLLPRHRVLLSLEKSYFTTARPRAVLCTSQQEVDDVHDFYGLDRSLLHVVPNGFDPSRFSVAERDRLRAATRDRIGIGSAEISVLCVANEWHRKGLGVLLDAVADLQDPRVRIDLVGRQDPGTYRDQASRLGLGDRLHWHGATSDVAPFYAAADVFALPTTYEPFGMVIVEAMAMGLPVVVPALAGATSVITHDVDGIVLQDPRDAGELAAGLRACLVESQRTALASAAPAAVASLSWEAVFTRADSLIFG